MKQIQLASKTVTDVASSTGEFASEQFEMKSGIGSGVAAVQEK